MKIAWWLSIFIFSLVARCENSRSDSLVSEMHYERELQYGSDYMSGSDDASKTDDESLNHRLPIERKAEA